MTYIGGEKEHGCLFCRVLADPTADGSANPGQIGLDDPRFEVADLSTLIDGLAQRDDVQLDGPGDPRVGVAGGSYGGALALLGAAYDHRIDAVAPQITWNSLTASSVMSMAARWPPTCSPKKPFV